jgi:hypothetical protein
MIPAARATTVGLEAYYRPGPPLLGSEYFRHDVTAPEKGDPSTSTIRRSERRSSRS